MKKHLTLFLVLLFSLLLVGCTKQYTYKFVNYDGTVISEGKGDEGSTITAPTTTPTKESTVEFDYVFKGWDKEVGTLDSDVTFTAEYNEVTRSYTIKFVDNSGNVISEEKVKYGTTPTEPEMEESYSTAEYTYYFTGWDKKVEKVTGEATYVAKYSSEKNYYTYKFVNANGAVLKSEEVEYGTTPVAPADPTKAATAEYTYTFKGWDKEIVAVTENVTYKAVFEETKNKYTYKFVDYDGTELKSEEVEYGTTPVAPTDPTRSADEKRTYTFKGWDKEIVAVTEDVTYTAVYTAKVNTIKYTSLEGKKLSILGDSISTFYVAGSEMNSYYSQSDRYYYPTYSGDVKTVDKTWYAQLISSTKMTFGVNNSWSGSTAIGTNESCGVSDARINTLIENGNPDIVIIYLGTNDVCSGYSAEQFKVALETMLTKIYDLCATQVYVCTLGYSAYTGAKYTDALRLEYNTVIRQFAKDNNIGVIPLDEYVVEDNYTLYLNDYLHYKYKGTTLLSQIAEKALCDYNEITYTKTIDVEHPVPEPKGHVTIGAINTGVWDANIYPNNVIMYSYDQMDQGSSYIYWYVVSITKDGDNYKVTNKKTLNIAETFETCDYFIMTSSAYPNHDFFDNVEVGDYLQLTGDISSGTCEFTLIEAK